MKVLVTGATGFVGSHLCEKLTNLGHEVYSLARSVDKFNEFKIQGHLLVGTLSENKRNDWIDGLPEDLDAVIHTAGIVHSFSKKDFHKVNHESTKQLILDLKEKYPHDLKFVFLSSLAAVGPTLDNIHRKEEHRPRPTSEYGKSKLRAEEDLKKLSPSHWSRIIIRPPMVIGPRDPAILDVFKMVKSGVVLMAGMRSKNKLYSYICVYDLVELVYKALLNNELKDEIFFAGHHDMITMDTLINKIKEKMQKKRTLNLSMPMPMISILAHTLEKLHRVRPINARITPDKIHELRPAVWTCDSHKSKQILDMTYHWDLDNTIEVTLEDYRQRGWL